MDNEQSGQAPAHHELIRIAGSAGARRHFRYFDYMMAAFVAILLLSNLIGAAKTATLGGWTFGAGILFFPVSYVLGDVLTEVYGYANARRCVWAGFFALIFMAFMSLVVVAMPPKADWWCASADAPMFAAAKAQFGSGAICQSTYESVFGSTWRIVLASVIAFWAGEFVNSFVMAKMKIWTGGKYLFTRTWGSTIFGQAVDSLLFYPIAFAGIWSFDTLLGVILFNWGFKITVEIVMTPLTYTIVNWLKRMESEDFYDIQTDFTPFSLKV